MGWLTRALANCLPPLATKQARPYRVGRAGRRLRNVPADPLKPSRTFNGSLVSAFTGTRDISNPIDPFTLPLTCCIVDGKMRKSCSVLLLLAQEALTQLMRNNHYIDRNTDGAIFSLLIPRNYLLRSLYESQTHKPSARRSQVQPDVLWTELRTTTVYPCERRYGSMRTLGPKLSASGLLHG